MPRPAIGSSSPDALELAPGLDPWQQQPGETDGAFARFIEYLQLHPLQRKDPQRVFEELQRRGDTKATNVSTIANMAALNQWPIRARAWDAYRRKREDEELAIASRRWADRLARRRIQAQLDHLDVSTKIRRKALEIVESKSVDDASLAEAKGLLELAFKIDRETLQLIRPTGAQAGQAGHLDDLSDDQTSARLRELADELARRMNNNTPSSPAAAAALDVVDAEVISQESSDHDYSDDPTDGTDEWTAEWSGDPPDDPAEQFDTQPTDDRPDPGGGSGVERERRGLPPGSS